MRSGFGRVHRAVRTTGKVLLGYAVVEAVAIVVFRTRWTPGINAVRRFNKRVLNLAMCTVAGRRYWYAAAVHHVGRSSGKPYVTPVLVVRAGERVYIPLPYGTDVDWCRNVLAAGHCTVQDHGTRYEVVDPEIVPADVALPLMSPRRTRAFRLYDVQAFLRGRVSANEPPVADPSRRERTWTNGQPFAADIPPAG